MDEQQNNISVTWAEVPGNGHIELMPVGEQQKHFLGDECWCGVRTSHAECGACKSGVAIFVHMPSNKIVPELVVTMLTNGAERAIAGGHRNNGQSR